MTRSWSTWASTTDVDAAKADYQAVHDLHTKDGLIGAYDAAVIERKENGKVKIVKKHETPTRVGGVGGGTLGLATGLVIALFPAAAIGGGLLAATTAGGAALGAVAGHAAAGMSRKDLKELGEHLDKGQAGLVVVAVVRPRVGHYRRHDAGRQGGAEGAHGRRRRDQEGRRGGYLSARWRARDPRAPGWCGATPAAPREIARLEKGGMRLGHRDGRGSPQYRTVPLEPRPALLARVP